MITADTITDEQIRELQTGASFDVFTICRDALQYHETVEPYASLRRDARARCAEILNAREAGAK
jgi:hypothetical protein